MQLDGDGEVEVKGPTSTVGGKEYEEVQCCLGDFEEWGHEVEEDVLEAVQNQVAVRNRMKEMEIRSMVTAQGSEAERKAKAVKKLHMKKQNAIVKRALLASAMKKDLHELQHNKKSRA